MHSRMIRSIICSNLPSMISTLFAYWVKMSFGKDIRFGRNIFIENPLKVSIESDCSNSNGVHIYTGKCDESIVAIAAIR